LPALCQQGSSEDQEFVFFAGGKFHSDSKYATCVPSLLLALHSVITYVGAHTVLVHGI
jgi:hypothetical protein